jgi:hypothetical protein
MNYYTVMRLITLKFKYNLIKMKSKNNNKHKQG